jgi:hypothetical protein
MLLGENPDAMDKHEAGGFYTAPCELAREVLNVAARLSIRGKKHLNPQAELSVGLQPTLFLLASRMGGALYPAAWQRVEARRIDIDQARLGFSGRRAFHGICHPVYSSVGAGIRLRDW